MSSKEVTKQQNEILKRLRTERADQVAAAQERNKATRVVQKQILEAIAGGAGTVPEIAEATGFASTDVLWHVTALKKYDRINELGQDGYYYKYAVPEEVEA